MKTRHILFICLLCTPEASLPGRTSPFPAGQIIDRVTCVRDTAHSYALYLPSGYTPSRKWPVIYAFDPAANGRIPVERLRNGAEKFGYIVAGSNNSRNGPWDPVLETIEAISVDTEARLSIDVRRIYTTGFSGGSRVASAIAMRSANVAGIIGCGAGFSRQYPPNPLISFVYIGLVGRGDMNYREMAAKTRLLTLYKIPNILRIFDGGHEWPPEACFTQALEWLEVQAMRKGLTPFDSVMVNTIFDKDCAEAGQLEKSGRLYDAWRRWSDLAFNFEGLADIRNARQNAGRLHANRAVRQRISLDEKLAEEEIRLRTKLLKALDAVDEDYYRKNGRLKKEAWWIRETERLLKRLNDAGTDDERWMCRRVIDDLWRNCYVRADNHMSGEEWLKSAPWLEIWGLFQPQSPFPSYNLAVALAHSGRPEDALNRLRISVGKGLNRPALLENECAFDEIRGTEAFHELIKAIHNAAVPDSTGID